MTIELLTLKDWLLAPIYITLLVLFTKYWADKYYAGSSIKKYILPALGVRVVGCILTACMYQYYYHGKDIFTYFSGVVACNDALIENPILGLKLLFYPINNFDTTIWAYLKEQSLDYFYKADPSNVSVIRIGTILSFFTFKSSLNIGLIMAYFSFLGCWKLFLVFNDLNPHLEKEMAIASLFIPSVCFWGAAGLMKDTIVMAALGYFVYSVYYIFIKKHVSILLILQFLLSFMLIVNTKIFIAMILIPTTLIWIFLTYQTKIKRTYQKLTLVFFLLLSSFSLIYIISKNDKKFNLTGIMNRAFIYQEGNINRTKKSNGISYNLGKFEPTVKGMISVLPKAILTSLFRPSVIDIRKGIMLPAALENFCLLVFILFSLTKVFKNKASETFRIILKPEIVFCFTFALAIFFISGFTAFNFGALVRYRMFGLPFFVVGLFVLSCNEPSKKLKYVSNP